MDRMAIHPVTPKRGYSLFPALPLLGNLLLGSLGGAAFAGCKPKQPIIATHPTVSEFEQKAAALKEYFKENKNLFIQSKMGDCSVTPYYSSPSIDKAVATAISNGWDVGLIKELSGFMEGYKLPGLSPMIHFVATEKDPPLGWLCVKKSAKPPMALNLPLRDITWLKDKRETLQGVIQHEIGHAEDSLYFCLTPSRISGEGTYQKALARLIKHAVMLSPERNKEAKMQLFAESIKDRTANNSRIKTSLDIRLADIRSEEKLPAKQVLGQLEAAMVAKDRKENYDGPNPYIDDLAYFILIADKMEEKGIAAHLREIVRLKCLDENKVLFDDLYELFNLQYEVSKRFIDRNTVLKRRPFPEGIK